jgi:outer membrane protein assembly factor BamB
MMNYFNKIKKPLVITFCLICLGLSSAVVSCKKKSLDLLDKAGILFLEKSLKQKNPLIYSAIFNKLQGLSDAKKKELIDLIRANDADMLEAVVEKIELIEQSKYCYLLNQEIDTDYIPVFEQKPFYKITNSMNIEKLNPAQERLYFSNINPFQYRGKKENIFKTEDHPKKQKQGKLNLSEFKDIDLQWQALIPEDMKSNFFYNSRQCFKRYEEPGVVSRVWNDTVIFRNEYQVFGYDLNSGKRKWTISASSNKQMNRYQTFRHPHHNSFGYEFLLSGGCIYAELNGVLVAAKITQSNKQPDVLWEKPLGEYRLATKPFLLSGNICCGIVNSKGEFWFAFFDASTGEIKKTQYVGLSSFFSQASYLDRSNNDKVFLISNHGFMCAIGENKSSVLWLNKFKPKSFSLKDYWLKEQYKSVMIDSSNINFDTQFITDAGENAFFFKPRESDTVYKVNTLTGKIRERIFNDFSETYLLYAIKDKVVFIDRQNNAEKTIYLVDIKSMQVLYKKKLNNGKLLGCVYSDNNMLLKIGTQIWGITIENKKIKISQICSPGKGWLVGADKRSIFVVDNKQFKCYRSKEHNPAKEYSNNEEPEGSSVNGSFMIKKQTVAKDDPEQPNPRGFMVKGEKLYPVLLDYYDDAQAKDFFLFINNDQLICTDSSGKILWQTQVFYNDVPISKIDSVWDMHKARIFGGFLWAGAKENVLLVNDGVNVVAYDIRSGEYLWSKTNTGETFLKAKDPDIQPDNHFFKQYGVCSYVVDNIMYRVSILEDEVLLSHGDKISLIDVETGQEKKTIFIGGGILDLISAKNNWAVLSQRKIITIDKNLEVLNQTNWDKFQIKHIVPKIYFIKENIVLLSEERIYLFSPKKQKIIDTVKVTSIQEHRCPLYKRIEQLNDQNICMIYPLKSIVVIGCENDKLKISWRFDSKTSVNSLFPDYFYASRFMFLFKDRSFYPIFENGKYQIVSLNLKNGNLQWQTEILKSDNLVYNISNAQVLGNSLQFIISLADMGQKTKLVPSETVNNVESFFVQLNYKTGVLEQIHNLKRLPLGRYQFDPVFLDKTDKAYLYGLGSEIIAAPRK